MLYDKPYEAFVADYVSQKIRPAILIADFLLLLAGMTVKEVR